MSTQETNLKAIADAIRAKEGTSGTIPAGQFAQRILNLPSGGDKVSKLKVKVSYGNIEGSVSYAKPNEPDDYIDLTRIPSDGITDTFDPAGGVRFSQNLGSFGLLSSMELSIDGDTMSMVLYGTS